MLSNPALANSINTEEIDLKLKKAILDITTGIREKLDQFTDALDLQEMKDIPLKVCWYLTLVNILQNVVLSNLLKLYNLKFSFLVLLIMLLFFISIS